MKNKTYILLVLLTLSLFNCARKPYCERKADKFARLIKDCPQLIDTITVVDTVYIRDTVTTSIPSKVDSSEFDNLLKTYCDTLYLSVPSKSNSNNQILIRNKLYNKYGSGVKQIIHKGDTIVISWDEGKNGLNLGVESVKKQITQTRTLVVPCPEMKWYNDPWKISVIVSLLWLVLAIVLKRR